jgi:Caspase domain
MGNRVFCIAVTIGMAILMMASSGDRAWAEKRAALVVGNSNYGSVPKLPNPSRDAIAVGQMFRDAGFDNVEVIVNASNLEFKRAIRKFEVDVDQADIAVVYYAGHGLEIGGVNYLIPVDAKLASDRDADDEAIALERLVASADGASKLRVIILDACRDNPFATSMRRDRKSNRVVASGLGKAEPSSTDTLIAYAAKAGSTAEDGDGQHSPFATALLKTLTVPGLDIRLAFGRVRDEVMRTTGSRQEPFVYGSLGGGNISLVPAPRKQEASDVDVKGDYELVAKIGTLRAWEVFLGTHKNGFYADLARVQIANLTEQQSGSVTRSHNGANNANNNNNVENGKTVVAAVPPPPASGRESSSQEALEWNKIRDSTDPAVFEKFIQKFPNAPLSITAQKRLDVLKQAQREREAAQKAAEDARIQAEQKKVEAAAAKKREDDERRAREAEAEQKAKAAEAERKAAEARQKAEQAARERAAAEAAAQRAAKEKEARDTEEARKKAERDAREAACKTEQAKLDQTVAKGGAGVDDLKSLAGSVTCERLSPQIAAALDKLKAEQARREREAAQKAAEEARLQAEQKKAEADAARKRADDERRAREAEGTEKAKATAAELAAAKKREDDERRAREAEAAEKAKAVAAELAVAKKKEEDERRAKAEQAEQAARAAEAKRKAEQAEQERAAAEAAAQRAASEKQVKEEERRAKAAETDQKAKAAEAERLAAEEKRKAEQAAKETACQSEQTRLGQIIAKGSEGSGINDLNAFAKSVTCDRLGAQIVAALDKFKADAAKRAAALPNSPQLILAAQNELVRLGCQLPGKPDGTLNDATTAALGRFLTVSGKPTGDLTVTTALVADLTKQTDRVCPLQCKANEVAKGDKCVAVDKPAAPAATSRKKDDDDDAPARRKPPPEKRQAEKEQRRPPPPAQEPHARQQAVARPSGGGGGGGGGHTMIGVGF